MLVPSEGYQHGGRKPTETSAIEFCHESVNSSLEELINIKVILFYQHKDCLDSKIPPNKSLFKPARQLSRPLRKCRVTQKVRNSSVLYHKTKNPFEVKTCKNIRF